MLYNGDFFIFLDINELFEKKIATFWDTKNNICVVFLPLFHNEKKIKRTFKNFFIFIFYAGSFLIQHKNNGTRIYHIEKVERLWFICFFLFSSFPLFFRSFMWKAHKTLFIRREHFFLKKNSMNPQHLYFHLILYNFFVSVEKVSK